MANLCIKTPSSAIQVLIFQLLVLRPRPTPHEKRINGPILEHTLQHIRKKKQRVYYFEKVFFCFPLFKEKYMSHLYGTGEITIAWQFAFCLLGNLFLEARAQSIEIIAGMEMNFCMMLII